MLSRLRRQSFGVLGYLSRDFLNTLAKLVCVLLFVLIPLRSYTNLLLATQLTQRSHAESISPCRADASQDPWPGALHLNQSWSCL